MARRRRIRIAYARISQETNAFSPELSTLENFRRLHWKEGDELHRAASRGGSEVDKLIANAELSGVLRAAKAAPEDVEMVPLFSVWALPGGPLADASFEALRDKLVTQLRAAGPVDGMALVLHGAMRGTPNHPEPEDEFLQLIREVLGPDVPLAVTYDLHANLTAAKATLPTVLAAYRSNPHWDLAWTGRRAGRMLIDTIVGRLEPTVAWRKLPMVLGGGHTIDFVPPMLPIFARMRWLEMRRQAVDTSLFMAHIWNDSTTLGWATYAITNGTPDAAERIVEDLADRTWEVRHIPPPRLLSPDAAVLIARRSIWARRLGVVCISDVSDNSGAGATGESTHLLRAFLEHGKGMLGYVAVRDAAAVDVAWDAGVGADIAVTVGGHMSPELYPPMPVAGRVISVSDTPHYGQCATIDLGDVKLVVTRHGPVNTKPDFWSINGLNPLKADMIAVKSIFHFRIYYAPIVRKVIGCRSPGVTDLQLWKTVDYERPTHPRDQVHDWRTEDAFLRGV